MKFRELEINEQLLRAIDDMGFVDMTAVSYTHLDVYKRQNRKNQKEKNALPATSFILWCSSLTTIAVKRKLIITPPTPKRMAKVRASDQTCVLMSKSVSTTNEQIV